MIARANDKVLSADYCGILAISPLHGFAVFAQLFALDIDVGQEFAEPGRHPPRGPPQNGHESGNECHSHQECVYGNAHCEPESDGFDGSRAFGNKGEEHKEHNESRCGHDSGTVGEPLSDRKPSIAGLDKLFAHSGDQEHLVVHGKTKQHRHKKYG